MPLLWVLRDTLNMTGTKFGCGMALCGLCTVHLTVKQRAPASLRSQRGGQENNYHRGLSADGSHPVQQAWMEKTFRSAAIASPDRSCPQWRCFQETHPTDSDIDDAMSGNICRCGTYQPHPQGHHRAASMQAGKAKSAA